MVTKQSKQRNAIKAFLHGNMNHPTAEEVYDAVRKEFPGISLGTVYRNLNLLTERGEIRRVRAAGGPDHYDFTLAEHAHFVCRICGRVSDLEADTESILKQVSSRERECSIDSCELTFSGICGDCRSRNGTV